MSRPLKKKQTRSLFAGFSCFLSSCSDAKDLSGRKKVQAALDSLASMLKSKYMNDHCWASVDMCSLLPQNLECVNPRTALLLRQNFDIPSCLCCLYAVCPQGHSLTGSELAACLWPCVVMEKVLETYC